MNISKSNAMLKNAIVLLTRRSYLHFKCDDHKKLLSIKLKLTARPNITSFHSDHNESVLSFLLNSTYKKLLTTYEHSNVYINHLLEEKSKLLLLINNENEMLNHENKPELFKRLNYLTQVSEIYMMIQKFSKDVRELKSLLEEMKNDSSNLSLENKEMCKAIESDLEELINKKDGLKYQMIQTLIPEEKEDKEDAIVELRLNSFFLTYNKNNTLNFSICY
jgi:regulator of replication initiation timing